MKTVCVVQARMGSSRLPGKVLKTLAGRPLLAHVVDRARAARRCDRVVVATSIAPADDAVAALCAELGAPCHRGDEANVFERMTSAAEAEGAEILVRLTGDNPFTPGELIDRTVDALTADGASYAAGLPESGYPLGLTVEAVVLADLKRLSDPADPAVREHVTWALRTRADVTRRLVAPERPLAPGPYTIDTPEDFARLAPVFERLVAADPAFGLSALETRNADGDAAAPIPR